MSAVEKPTEPADHINIRKWGAPLLKAGWTTIPNAFFEYQQALGLEPLDVNILLHIASHWWKPAEKPWPSKGLIAASIGVHPRTVQRRIAHMEKAGFIKREQRRVKGMGSKTNIYHFDGLIKAALPFAAEKVEQIEQRKAEKKARATRKGKTKFRVVVDNAEL
jgi:DNA-binding transcriptional regulator YhcF (GntR family)